jgi:hypothetical protein
VARPFNGESKLARRNLMKFLSVYRTVETDVPPSQEEMARMGKLIEEGMKAGYLLAVEGCLPSALGARVRLSNGKVNVTDGPFTEAKEVIGGFALFQVNSKAEPSSTPGNSFRSSAEESASYANYTRRTRIRRRGAPGSCWACRALGLVVRPCAVGLKMM